MRNNGHFMYARVEGGAGGRPLHAWASIRLPSVHEIDTDTGRRGWASPPVSRR
jgi:hypothetical protein